MEIVLLNKNPAVSKLVRLSLEKIGYNLEEISSLAQMGQKNCDIFICDSDLADESVDYTAFGKEVIFLIPRNFEKKLGKNSLEKPFLPTDFIDFIQGICAKFSNPNDTLIQQKEPIKKEFSDFEEIPNSNDLENFDGENLDLAGSLDGENSQENAEVFSGELLDDDEILSQQEAQDLKENELKTLSSMVNEIDKLDEQKDSENLQDLQDENLDIDDEFLQDVKKIAQDDEEDLQDENLQMTDESLENSNILASDDEISQNEEFSQDDEISQNDEFSQDDEISQNDEFPQDNEIPQNFDENLTKNDEISQNDKTSKSQNLDENFDEIAEDEHFGEILKNFDDTLKSAETSNNKDLAQNDFDDLKEIDIANALGDEKAQELLEHLQKLQSMQNTAIQQNLQSEQDGEILQNQGLQTSLVSKNSQNFDKKILSNELAKTLNAVISNPNLKDILKGMKININISFEE